MVRLPPSSLPRGPEGQHPRTTILQVHSFVFDGRIGTVYGLQLGKANLLIACGRQISRRFDPACVSYLGQARPFGQGRLWWYGRGVKYRPFSTQARVMVGRDHLGKRPAKPHPQFTEVTAWIHRTWPVLLAGVLGCTGQRSDFASSAHSRSAVPASVEECPTQQQVNIVDEKAIRQILPRADEPGFFASQCPDPGGGEGEFCQLRFYKPDGVFDFAGGIHSRELRIVGQRTEGFVAERTASKSTSSKLIDEPGDCSSPLETEAASSSRHGAKDDLRTGRGLRFLLSI